MIHYSTQPSIKWTDEAWGYGRNFIIEGTDIVSKPLPCQEKDSRRMESGTMLTEALPTTQKEFR